MVFCCNAFEPLSQEEQEAAAVATNSKNGGAQKDGSVTSTQPTMSPRSTAGSSDDGDEDPEFVKTGGSKENILEIKDSETSVADEEILVSGQ